MQWHAVMAVPPFHLQSHCGNHILPGQHVKSHGLSPPWIIIDNLVGNLVKQRPRALRGHRGLVGTQAAQLHEWGER